MTKDEKIEFIQMMTTEKRVVRIQYQKSVDDINPKIRLVEPYSLTTGKEDIMLRGYQIDPEPGSRFFMLHKIMTLQDNGTTFTSRAKGKAKAQTIKKLFDPYEAWTENIQEYRDLVLGAMTDLVVSPEEIRLAALFRKERSISDQQMHSVHASIFMRCLSHVLADGEIEFDEKESLISINKNLTLLGCGVLGK